MVCSNTLAPSAQFIQGVSSLGEWLMPPTLGTKIMPIGPRRAIICALFLSLIVIPAWAFGESLPVLVVGAFLMQVGVQGAWGIVPAHLNELSPDNVRGLMPGLAYQLGILIAAPVNNIGAPKVQ